MFFIAFSFRAALPPPVMAAQPAIPPATTATVIKEINRFIIPPHYLK
jgi:hypothetical protein